MNQNTPSFIVAQLLAPNRVGNEELKFATITIEKTNFDVSFLKPGIFYHLNYTIKIKNKGDKTYINCYITPEKKEECDGEDLII